MLVRSAGRAALVGLVSFCFSGLVSSSQKSRSALRESVRRRFKDLNKEVLAGRTTPLPKKY